MTSIKIKLIITTNCVFYFYCYNSTLLSGPPFNYSNKPYSKTEKLGNGTIIDVELNMENKTIKFYINGKDYGNAYEGIPTDKPLKLCVLLSTVGDQVELLSNSKI
jgi:hypothetical protein